MGGRSAQGPCDAWGRRASGLKVFDVLWLHGGIMACVEGGQEAQLSVAVKGDH